MDEVLFGVLTEHVGNYLDGVECGRAEPEDVRRLAAAWRALLDLHRPAGRRGRCQGCVDSHRHSAAMCNVWRVANAFFIRRGT